MAAAEPTDPLDHELEARICDRARDFDPPALLRLLSEHFPGRPIRLRAYESSSPQRTMVQSIVFESDEIAVYLNAGLLSSTSPLPSYFNELLIGRPHDSGLHRLLEALNEVILALRVAALWPEASPRLLPWVKPWAQTLRRGAVGLSAPASPNTLHWIFHSVFPELRVTVRRTDRQYNVALADVCLGQTPLGLGALGGEIGVPAAGFDVWLRADDPESLDGRAWAVEGKRRIASLVLPALVFTGVPLRVLLLELGPAPALALRNDIHLGFHPLAAKAPPHVSILFDGRTSDVGEDAIPRMNLAPRESA